MDKAPESDVAPAVTPDIKAEPEAHIAPPLAPDVAPRIEPKVEMTATAAAPEVTPPRAEAVPGDEAAADVSSASWWQTLRAHRYAPLAASVAVALVLGGALGSAATIFSAAPPPPVESAAVKETRALKDTVTRLSAELATFKASLDAGHRNATAQFGKIADRMDRVEKAQAEPAAKLAKIADAVDRLERRPAPQPVVAAADITNSIPAAKPAPKVVVLEGWTVMEFGSGRAVVENRGGQLFEIGPGSTIPGIGKVESIKRDDGRVVVSTPKGIIVSMVEPRRTAPAPYYAVAPYRRY